MNRGFGRWRWADNIKAGVYMYHGFGGGSYFSNDGYVYHMSAAEAAAAAEEEGVKFERREA